MGTAAPTGVYSCGTIGITYVISNIRDKNAANGINGIKEYPTKVNEEL